MSRRTIRSSKSPPTPGEPGPSLSSSIMAGPSKRKRSISGDVRPGQSNIAQGAKSSSPRRRVKVEDREPTATASSGEWTYQLEIVQQPQRARACGFGDKDRRPLSPPPILRLWVRDSAGQLVDPSLISISFLVLMVDLWSADGERHKNVVMHPSSQGSSRADSPTRTFSEQTSRPGTAQSTGWPGPPYRMTSGPHYPSVLSPLLSPHAGPVGRTQASGSGWATSSPLPPPPHGARPATMRGRSFTRPMPSHVDPARPTTAPSTRPAVDDHQTPLTRRRLPSPDRSPYTLPPISSITLLDREGPSTSTPSSSRLTLPSLHDRPSTRDTQSSSSAPHSHDFFPFGRPTSSSSTGHGPWYSSSEPRHKDSMSSVASEVLTPIREAGPPFERPLTGTAPDRPLTGYGSDRPPSSSYDRPFSGGGHPLGYDKPQAYHWDRPTTTGGGGGHGHGHVTFDAHSRGIDRDSRSIYLSPRQTHQHRLSNASSVLAPPNYSRVLVGSLCAACQRLQDEDGHTGLFFFAHDLGVRTEGTFTLKFTLTDLSSLMRQSVLPGEKVNVLAQAYSMPFTVFSAKRFPGVIPTTELTRHFAKQGVRLPTRQKRTAAGDSDNEGEAGDED